MNRVIHNASARQHAGGIPDRGGNRNNNRAGKPGLIEIEAEIAGLFARSTQELRLAWRQLHRTEPPFGISRDLLIRSLAYELQQRAHGGPLAGLGVRQDDIAKIIDCAPKTLRKRLRNELDRGVAEANATISGHLFAAAKAGNVIAQMFWLKTRAHWREKTGAR
jgi:hypothetical protein